MKKIAILLIFLPFLFSNCVPQKRKAPEVVKGVLDLRSVGVDSVAPPNKNALPWDFEKDGIVELNGEWEFYWKEFRDFELCKEGQVCVPDKEPAYINVPSAWNNYKIDDKPLGGFGFATYRLRILLPSHDKKMQSVLKENLSLRLSWEYTAYKLFVNGELLSEVGKIGEREEESIPKFYPQVLDIPSNDLNSLDIVIHISNFHHRGGGGLWDPLYIGERTSIHSEREKSLGMDFFLAGSFLIMGFYHQGLFLLRRKDRSTLYFGIYCILLSLHSLLTGECFFYQLFPALPFQWGIKLDYLSFYVGTPVFIIFLKNAFSEDVHERVVKSILFPSFFLSLVVLFFPSQIFTRTIVWMHILILISCLYTIYLMFLCSFRKRAGAKSFLIGILVFTLFIIDDILYVNGIIQFGGQYSSIGFFWLIFSQSFVLSIRFSSAFVKIEDLSENLENQNRVLQEQSTQLEYQNTLLKKLTSEIFETNSAYEKFFPSQFIQLLEKDHITKLTLGDQTGREMSVLFSDIRSFTTLSESMTPKENFDFINGYLSRIGPFIRKYNGFIDKYMGDNIMALFDKNPNHAVDAGIEMLEELYRYNQVRMSKGRIPISIGIGIHTGNLTLGIIGEAGRMEGTVIADAVNLASRLEGLTKMYGASLLISEDMLNKMSNLEKYQFRKVDTVKVKGKNTAVGVIEIINGNSEKITNLKLSTKNNFEEGVRRYLERNFSEAVKCFGQVLEKDPLDKAAKIHYERSLYYAKHGVPPDWEGVSALETK